MERRGFFGALAGLLTLPFLPKVRVEARPLPRVEVSGYIDQLNTALVEFYENYNRYPTHFAVGWEFRNNFFKEMMQERRCINSMTLPDGHHAEDFQGIPLVLTSTKLFGIDPNGFVVEGRYK